MSYQQIENITLNESINVNQFLNLQTINKTSSTPYNLEGNLTGWNPKITLQSEKEKFPIQN